MRILLVHELFPPYGIGGGEIYVETLYKELLRFGHDVFLVVGDGKKVISRGKYKTHCQFTTQGKSTKAWKIIKNFIVKNDNSIIVGRIIKVYSRVIS